MTVMVETAEATGSVSSPRHDKSATEPIDIAVVPPRRVSGRTKRTAYCAPRQRKLSSEQEAAVRSEAGNRTLRELAAEFGVSHETIRAVVRQERAVVGRVPIRGLRRQPAGAGRRHRREVGPEIGVMADFFHMNIEEADIPASIRAAAPRLVYVHVADSNRLQPGRGHLDFRPGFRALKEIGYDGPLAIECRVDGPYDDAIREAAELIRKEWAAA